MSLDENGRLKPIGFWSYARQDDELSDGQLSALRVALSRELQQLYGRQPLKIWQDVAAIAPGAEWERSIDEAIGQSTFLIPIITPNFIESEWCCREVEKFLAREKVINAEYPDLKAARRIFPIGYLPIDGGVPHSPAVAKELQKLQFADFTALRYEDPKSSEFRRAVGALAGAVCALLKTPKGRSGSTPKPAPPPSPPPPPKSGPTSSHEPEWLKADLRSHQIRSELKKNRAKRTSKAGDLNGSKSKPAQQDKKDFEQWFDDRWGASGYIKPKRKPVPASPSPKELEDREKQIFTLK